MNNKIIKSFIPVLEESHFPIQNIPFGVFAPDDLSKPRIGIAIGEHVLDLSVIDSAGFLNYRSTAKNIFDRPSLNCFMSLGKKACADIRLQIQNLLKENNPVLRDDSDLRNKSFYLIKDVKLFFPVEIGDYTDFYSSKDHATNVGIMFRGKENALMPNWLHLPVAYHGRASSVVLSGTDIIRPKGQIKKDDSEFPEFQPTSQLDIELEMGFFIGKGNELGIPIPVGDATEHIFGMVLVNDWSARDIQKWEYVPLGPFLSKNFATSISPWVVMLEALEPFKTDGAEQIPEPLPYLRIKNFTYKIELEVYLKTKNTTEAFKISHSNFKYLYWNIAQQLAHHTITGCNTRTGDLMASGTISGPDKQSFGCFLELTWRGTEPVILPNGEERKFLQDGDEIIIKGYCRGDGYKIGFGEVTGKIFPAT